MGLQVWLPLNGNIDNQGLSNYQATNTNAIINTNGKIGKCYQFGPNQSYLELPKECMRNLSTECTVSFWIKFITRNSNYETYFQAGLGGIAWNNYVFGLLRNNNGNSCCFTISNGSSASSASYTTPNLTELNTWYHITLVYKTGHCLVYMNGELYQDYTTTIIPAFDKITTITIGCGNTKTSYQTNCLMNDFRIYDEALSPREIKEISKGLVLHYPLNRGGFGGDNLLHVYNHNIYHQTNNASIYPINRQWLFENGVEYEHITRTSIETNPTIFSIYGYVYKTALDSSITAGMEVTVSVWVRCSHNLNNAYLTFLEVGKTSIEGAITPIKANQWTKLSLTTTLQKSYSDYSDTGRVVDISVYGISIPSGEISNFYFDFRQDYKMELGTLSTPWIPNQADDLYSQMGIDNNIEYDVSGYGHNATKTGDITYTSNTPRYNVSTSINTNGSCLVVSGLTTTGFSNSFSIAWWGNVSDFSNKMMWGFRDGIRLNGIYNGNLWNTGDGSNNPIYQPGTTTKVTAPSVGVWHHYVMTGDGTNNYLYVDGALYGESKTYKGISGTTIYFNGWTDSSDYRYAGGLKLSDFRIYATALSEDDIMALYHTPISLANNGTLLTQGEYVES